METPVYVEYECREGLKLSLYERDSFSKNIGRLPIFTPVGALTSTELYVCVEDLTGIIERLHAAGAQQLSPRAPRAWGDEAAYFADPDGNVIAVARRII